MNARVKKLWLKVLRSGKFKQGKRALHPKPDEFCCLGVLCELYRKREGEEWDDYADDGYFESSFLGEENILPDEVQQWAGLDSIDPPLSRAHNARSASVLNDAGETFEHIANRIEKYL